MLGLRRSHFTGLFVLFNLNQIFYVLYTKFVHSS